MLDVMHEFCLSKGMEVNVPRPEIVVFHNARSSEVLGEWL